MCKDEDPAAFDMVREEDAILRQLNAKDRNRQADSYDLLYQPEQGSFTDADEEQEPPYADMYPNSKPVCLEDFADIPPCDDDFYAGTAPAIAAPVFWEQPRPAFAGNTELSEVRADAAQSAQEEYWPGLQPSAAQDVAQPAAFRPSVQPEVQNQAAPAGNSQQAAVRPQTAGIAAQSVAAVAAAATKAYFAQQAAQTAMPSDGTIQPARKAQPAASATAVASSQNMTAYNTAAQSKEETAQFAQPAARVNPAADTGASARPAVQASASAPAMVQGMNAVSATAARSASQAVPAAMPSHENAQASAPAQGNKVSGKAQSAPASKAAEPAASEESAEPYWRKSVQKALKEAADSAAARNTTASLEELAVAYENLKSAKC